MRKLLEKEEVVLNSLYVVYDDDHHCQQLLLGCSPSIVTSTGRKVTQAQLAGITKVLCFDSDNFLPVFLLTLSQSNCSSNLLSQPVPCQLVFSSHVLVAIGKQDGKQYCDLETGNVVDEETLFAQCKLRAMERTLSEIKFLERRLKEEMTTYEELEQLNF